MPIIDLGISDEVGASDAVAVAMVAWLTSDTVGASDAASTLTVVGRDPSDTVTVSDPTTLSVYRRTHEASDTVTPSDALALDTGGPLITGTLPGPKPARYWTFADLDKLRQALVTIDTWGSRAVQLFPARWDDVQGQISIGTGLLGLTLEGYPSGSSYAIYHMRWDQVDSLSFTIQMPHRYRRDTEVRVHLHYVPCVAPTVNPEVVALSGRYTWAHPKGAIPAWASWTTWSTTFNVATGDENKQNIAPLFNTTPTGSKESSMLLIHMQRDGAAAPGGTDTYETSKGYGTNQANLGILYLDAHYQSEKFGTTNPIPE